MIERTKVTHKEFYRTDLTGTLAIGQEMAKIMNSNLQKNIVQERPGERQTRKTFMELEVLDGKLRSILFWGDQNEDKMKGLSSDYKKIIEFPQDGPHLEEFMSLIHQYVETSPYFAKRQ